MTTLAPAEMNRQTEFWLEVAQETEVCDEPSSELAAAHLVAIAELKAAADQSFDPIITKAYAAHREALAQKKRITDPLDRAVTLLKNKVGSWLQAERRKRDEEERAAREEADRIAAEEREREILAAEALGASQEEIAVMVEAPLVRAPVVAPPVYKPAGVSGRETWSAEVVDLAKLIQYVATRPEFSNLLVANQPALNAMARSLRGACNIPGVRAVSNNSVTVRRS